MYATTRRKDDSILSFALTVLGSVVALVGTVALSNQLLNPACFIGAVNYVTVGAILMYSNSKRIQYAAYGCVPRRIKLVLFESSILDLFQDQSRCIQLAAYLVACLTLRENKVQNLYRTLPDSFDNYKRCSIWSAMFNSKAPEDPSPGVQYKTRRAIEAQPENGSAFVVKALRESAAHMASHIVTEAKTACTRTVASLVDRVATAAREYAPCAGLLSASVLVYWNLLQQHTLDWRQIATQLHGAEKRCWEYARSVASLPALSFDACGTSLVPLSQPATLLVCGVAAASAKMYCSNDSSDNTAPKVTAVVRADPVMRAPEEKLSAALFALLVAVRGCKLVAFAHPMVNHLLPRATAAMQHRKGVRACVATTGATVPGEDCVQALRTRCAALRLSQCVVMALALRLGVPFAHYRWLVMVLYLRICRGCRTLPAE